MSAKRAVLIAGPTASGKSRAALEIAERTNGVIVNADSMQVYRELAILSARPGVDDEARVPHRLYGCVPASEAYSVGRWLDDVSAELDEIWRDGRLPVIVGGTGLYFRALFDGLVEVPEIPDAVRRHWRGRLDGEGAHALHALLRQRDHAAAERIKPADSQRILRALEVLEATGRPLSAWQSDHGGGGVLADAEPVSFVLWPKREQLYARCDARFDAMIDAGALDEVRRLMDLGLDPGLPAMKALGVRQLIAHLRGEIDLETAATDVKTWTRRYAKRQMTWFRRNMISWNVIEMKDSETFMGYIFSILCENELTADS